MATTVRTYGEVQEPKAEHHEWTRVRRKSRRNTGKSQHQHQAQHQTQHQTQHQAWARKPAAGPVARPDYNTTTHLSVSDIQRDHVGFEAQWQESACQRQLKDLVASKSCRQPTVTQAVCLGIGSFDPEDGAWEVKRRAHVQLSAFLSIVADLQQDLGKPSIRCFFQEPLFTSADEDFIRGLGHEVVESPGGFEMVDRETLVFGVHLYRDIYNQAISKCVPAVFIGTGLDVWEGYHGSGDLDWTRMEELDRKCDRVPFPEDEGFTTFSSTSIHWRKPDQT